MRGSQAIREDNRCLNEHSQMVLLDGANEIDEVYLYQCSSCQQWYCAGDTYVTGSSTEYCYNEPCRKLQDQ
jgi:hypothetical protein